MLVCFHKGRHLFEGFCVPDFVCRYWVGEEERNSSSRKAAENTESREGGRKREKTRKTKTGSRARERQRREATVHDKKGTL